jgi:glycosyltransferase involved in cell wall biosynthesis
MNSGISIVIRTFNSARTLPLVLERLRLLPGDEIIVVDSGSTDATLIIAEKYHVRIVVAEKPFNYSKSLNLGFYAAQHSWVLVISSHCVPQSEDLLACFRCAVQQFPDTVAVAYGDCSLTQNSETGGPSLLFVDKTATKAEWRRIYGGNGLALYRRDCWLAQPFDETLPTAEDLAWFLRALTHGAVVARVSAARVLYRNQGSLRHMFRKGWLESRMDIQLTGGQGMSLWQLGISWGSLLKKWGTAKIPWSVLLRQVAHALGAYISPKFFNRSIK